MFLRPLSRHSPVDEHVQLYLLLQVIDLGDTMTFSALPGQADALTCNMPGVPVDASNLVIKVRIHQHSLLDLRAC